MKETAVEWLVEQIEQYILTYGNLPFNVLSKLKKQAKASEKKQQDLLNECEIQLEYLNQKFGETGTTNALLAKLKNNYSKEDKQ